MNPTTAVAEYAMARNEIVLTTRGDSTNGPASLHRTAVIDGTRYTQPVAAVQAAVAAGSSQDKNPITLVVSATNDAGYIVFDADDCELDGYTLDDVLEQNSSVTLIIDLRTLDGSPLSVNALRYLFEDVLTGFEAKMRREAPTKAAELVKSIWIIRPAEAPIPATRSRRVSCREASGFRGAGYIAGDFELHDDTVTAHWAMDSGPEMVETTSYKGCRNSDAHLVSENDECVHTVITHL